MAQHQQKISYLIMLALVMVLIQGISSASFGWRSNYVQQCYGTQCARPNCPPELQVQQYSWNWGRKCRGCITCVTSSTKTVTSTTTTSTTRSPPTTARSPSSTTQSPCHVGDWMTLDTSSPRRDRNCIRSFNATNEVQLLQQIQKFEKACSNNVFGNKNKIVTKKHNSAFNTAAEKGGVIDPAVSGVCVDINEYCYRILSVCLKPVRRYVTMPNGEQCEVCPACNPADIQCPGANRSCRHPDPRNLCEQFSSSYECVFGAECGGCPSCAKYKGNRNR